MSYKRFGILIFAVLVLFTVSGCQFMSIFENIFGKEVSLYVTVEPIGSGIVTPPNGSKFKKGEIVYLIPTPYTDYVFSHWGGPNAYEINTYNDSIVMDGNKTLIAHFEPLNNFTEYNLNVNVTGSGTVTQTLIADGSAKYASGAVVRLMAVEDPGWAFDHWEGDLTGSDNPRDVTMDADKNITAVFVQLGPQTITGAVTDGRSGPVVVGATVDAVSDGATLDSTVTDAQGKYSFTFEPGTSFDLVVSQTGYASTRFQGIVLNRSMVADIVVKKVFNPSWSTNAPQATVTGITPGMVLTGTVNFQVEITSAAAPARSYFGVRADTIEYLMDGYPFNTGLDTTAQPDGPGFIFTVSYDINNNSVITRTPVIFNNGNTGGTALVMTEPVFITAITEGDDMQYDSLSRLATTLTKTKPAAASMLKSLPGVKAADPNSSCYVILDWDPEFAETYFKGYKVYRSGAADGPWRHLGMAYLYYDDYYGYDRWMFLDLSAEVTPNLASYYKVVPVNANGTEGEPQCGSVTPLGRFEVNLETPDNNATYVSLNPTFSFSNNGVVADKYYYTLTLKDLVTNGMCYCSFETDLGTAQSVVYDSTWNDYFPLNYTRKYQWDIENAVAKSICNANAMAVSIGYKGSSGGSYNGAFTFTTMEP